MTVELSLPLAFVTGLLGALHCLGMCSGLAGGWFVRVGQGPGALLTYHAARLLVYGVLGTAGALAGRVLAQQGLVGKGQGLIMLAAGLVILGLGLTRLWPWPGGGLRRTRVRGTSGMQPVTLPSGLHRAAPRSRLGLSAVAGAVNGLVPCSLTASVAMAGAATGDPGRAALLMLAFGLGTLPTMALVSLLGIVLGRQTRGLIVTLGGLAVVGLGLWTLREGWLFFAVMRGLSN